MNVSQHTTCKMIITFNVKIISGYHIKALVSVVSTANSKMESSPCPGKLKLKNNLSSNFYLLLSAIQIVFALLQRIDGFLRLTIQDTCCHAVAM